jgi:hypothetical protein
MSTTTRILRTVAGPERLFAASVFDVVDWTKSATDFWTFTLYRRASGQTTGRIVGSPLSLRTRGLLANTPLALYRDTAGLRLGPGDELVLEITSTGSPVALSDPKAQLDIQELTR